MSCAEIWARRLYRQSKRQEETQRLQDITASPRAKSQRWKQGTGQGKSSPSSPLPPCPFCSPSKTFLTLLLLEQLPRASQRTPPSKEASKRCHVCLWWKFRLCSCSFFWHRSPPRQAGGNHSRKENEPVCVAGCWRGLASLPGGDYLLRQPRRGLRGTFRQVEKPHGACLCARGRGLRGTAPCNVCGLLDFQLPWKHPTKGSANSPHQHLHPLLQESQAPGARIRAWCRGLGWRQGTRPREPTPCAGP